VKRVSSPPIDGYDILQVHRRIEMSWDEQSVLANRLVEAVAVADPGVLIRKGKHEIVSVCRQRHTGFTGKGLEARIEHAAIGRAMADQRCTAENRVFKG